MLKIILFIGVPGSGKGTIGKLCEKYGYIHISSSKLLRDAGYDLKNSKDIPNEVTISLIKEIISNTNKNATIILEGFPRRFEQLELLEKEFEIQKAIYLKIPKSQALKRIQNRIECINCGEIYTTNLFKYPKSEDICDKCGCILKKRSGDNKEIFEMRYRFFVKYTYPVISYYGKQKKLITVDALQSSNEIISIINSL